MEVPGEISGLAAASWKIHTNTGLTHLEKVILGTCISSVPIVCRTHVLVQTVSAHPTWCAVLISKTVLLGKCQ